jgi:hypothetical protein
MSSEIAPDVLSSHSSSADPSSPQDTDGNVDQANIIENSENISLIDKPENQPTTENQSDRLGIIQKLPLTIPKTIWQMLQDLPLGWLVLAVSIGGVIITAIWGLRYLTALEANPDSGLVCQSKITGDWQTPFGKLSLKEIGNQKVTGQYEYSNLDRGKVKGEFTGKLHNNVINFAWKEGADQQGKGIFVFSEGCMEFFGSYGIADSTNNFGNWQGYRINK